MLVLVFHILEFSFYNNYKDYGGLKIITLLIITLKKYLVYFNYSCWYPNKKKIKSLKYLPYLVIVAVQLNLMVILNKRGRFKINQEHEWLMIIFWWYCLGRSTSTVFSAVLGKKKLSLKSKWLTRIKKTSNTT